MRDKAGVFFEEVRHLVAAKKYNGAASRLYYALYHIVTAILDEKGIKLSDLSSKVNSDNTEFWPNDVVRFNSTLAGFTRTDAQVFRKIWDLRIQSDYKPHAVTDVEILGLIEQSKHILNALGVPVK